MQESVAPPTLAQYGVIAKEIVSNPLLKVFWLGLQPYEPILHAMKTQVSRLLQHPDDCDQLWLLHHYPVYTLGARGLETGLIGKIKAPVVKSDRGGDVTYHGPGQLVGYPLLNLKRLRCSGAGLVHSLESLLIEALTQWGLEGVIADEKRPGVYLQDSKLASIGLRCKRKGAVQVSYHGFALNMAMDLSPFEQINPCGYAGQHMSCVNGYETALELPSPAQIIQHPVLAENEACLLEPALSIARSFSRWHTDALSKTTKPA